MQFKLCPSNAIVDQRWADPYCYILDTILMRIYRHILQAVLMLSIAINRAELVCAILIIKHNYILLCEHKLVTNTLLLL